MPSVKQIVTAPRGMAIAKKTAREVHERMGSVKDCLYKSKSWRSCFCKEMERLQQVSIKL